MKLRPGQIEVAAYTGGYLGVPAVPGAGKTTCLAYLTAELLEQNPEDRILIVTVMNSAVSNFKHKIVGFLAERGMPSRGYEVKTLHSLAVQILREAPEFLMVNDAFQIIDEYTQKHILKPLIDRWLDQNSKRWKAFLKDDISPSRFNDACGYWRNRIFNMIIDTIKHIKLQGITEQELQHIREQLESQKDSFLLWTIEVMEQYEEYKRHNGAVDFDDMINLAYQLLLENKDVRERLQERWTYIFEDEAQDSNPLQEKILQILSEKNGNLVRVGDVNQGIMRFTGTDPELFRKFCRDYKKQPIFVASRSTQQIMDFANSYVRWVRESYPVHDCRDALEDQMIRGVAPDDPCPNPLIEGSGISTYTCNGDIEDEVSLVAEKAANFALANQNKTIAILMRQNKHLKQVAHLLQHRKVEFDFVGGGPDWDKEFHQVTDIIKIMRYLAQPYQKDQLFDVLMVLMPYLEEGAKEALKEFLKKHEPEDLLYPVLDGIDWSMFPAEFPSSKLPQIKKAFDKIRNWLEISHMMPDELVLQLAAELGLEGDQKDMANNMSVRITMVLWEHPEYDLADIMREFEIIDNYLNHMAGVLQGARGYSPRPSVISLSTYHKAKGLEWDTVYITGLAKGGFCELINDKSMDEFGYLPDDYKNPNALVKAQLKYMLRIQVRNKDDIIRYAKIMTISECLRLLYVAFTRARERLVIGTHSKNKWDNNLHRSIIFSKINAYLEGESHE